MPYVFFHSNQLTGLKDKEIIATYEFKSNAELLKWSGLQQQFAHSKLSKDKTKLHIRLVKLVLDNLEQCYVGFYENLVGYLSVEHTCSKLVLYEVDEKTYGRF